MNFSLVQLFVHYHSGYHIFKVVKKITVKKNCTFDLASTRDLIAQTQYESYYIIHYHSIFVSGMMKYLKFDMTNEVERATYLKH